MPDLIRHPEALERTGFRLEFIPMKIGAGMTPTATRPVSFSVRGLHQVLKPQPNRRTIGASLPLPMDETFIF